MLSYASDNTVVHSGENTLYEKRETQWVAEIILAGEKIANLWGKWMLCERVKKLLGSALGAF